MGACLSCIGLGQHHIDPEPCETERLLYEDNVSDSRGYGAASRGDRLPARDPEELRRQREMLEAICAETANNLIDVQDTSLLTLRGKASTEFAALLNSHFRSIHPDALSSTTDQDPPSSATDNDHSDPTPLSSAPQTPDPNRLASSPPEPPSPFTQAQLAAQSSQNGHTKHHHSLSGGLSHASYAQAAAAAPSPLAQRSRPLPGYARQLSYGASSTNGPLHHGLRQDDGSQGMPGTANTTDEDEESRREAAWLAEVTRHMGSTDPASIRAEAAQSLIVDLGPSIRNDDDDDDDDYSGSDREQEVIEADDDAERRREDSAAVHPFSRAEAGMDHRGQQDIEDDEEDDDDEERGYEFVPGGGASEHHEHRYR